MLLYALTVVLSAFLLFLVQPIAGRVLLPQFGGSAGVWATCLMFFQLGLLLGYLYGHWLATKLAPRVQVLVHAALLAASLVLLPFARGWGSGASSAGDPTMEILAVLLALVGLPFVMLSASTPLLQSWYARSHGSELPYRLFAFSNAGSLAGLLCYPFLVEPQLSLRHQMYAWAAGYGVFAVLTAALALSGGRRVREATATHDESGSRPAKRDMLIWIALAACSSAMLLAVTNLMTRDVAPVPLLWILPLSLYLISFIACFSKVPWYRSTQFGWLVTAALFALALALAYSVAGDSLWLSVGLLNAGLLVCCLFCHGELARLKPDPSHLTRFYLMIAAGGALGGLYVALIAPWTYNESYEFPVSMALCAFLAWRLMPRTTVSTIRLVLSLALIVYVSDAVYTPVKQARVAARNFYGTVKVIDSGEGKAALRTLLHGTVRHGSQFLSPERRKQGTAYYGPQSGGALAIGQFPAGQRQVGVVGLGAGTMAVYGRAGDTFRFYELNPRVIDIARTQFTYLGDCPCTVETVGGDARLSLVREPPQGFDVLVLDAFSGDSVPAHLLSREAFEVYFRHLKPRGVLAFHVSNRFLDLTSVVARGAVSLGKSYLAVQSPGSGDDQTLTATWVLVSSNRELLESSAFKGGYHVKLAPGIRPWTDDYSNLFQALR